MDELTLKSYIEKLKELEKTFNDEMDKETYESNPITELDNIIQKLNTDLKFEKNIDDFALNVKVKKLHEDAVIPKYSKEDDAGLDLTVTSIISNTTFDVTYGFGLAIEIPKGYVGLLFPRSSVYKYELLLSNCVGVIDSGYRGEIMAIFKKEKGLDSLAYRVGDRAAQLIILPYPKINLIESDELSNTKRGNDGYGSTGN